MKKRTLGRGIIGGVLGAALGLVAGTVPTALAPQQQQAVTQRDGKPMPQAPAPTQSQNVMQRLMTLPAALAFAVERKEPIWTGRLRDSGSGSRPATRRGMFR